MDLLYQERRLWKRGKKIVVGLDEAGRGPLAGPVFAAAVYVKKGSKKKDFPFIREIKDSKKLSPPKREKIFNEIIKSPKIEWGIGKVSERVIDKINILKATKLAMKRAVKNLEKKLREKSSSCKNSTKVNYLIIDGNFKVNLEIPQKPIIKGDEKVFSVIAASIIAKVKRDRMMLKYHKKYPQYGFDKHKGYPTKHHKLMIKKYGASELHRQTFKGVK